MSQQLCASSWPVPVGSLIVNGGKGRYFEPGPGRSFPPGVDLHWSRDPRGRELPQVLASTGTSTRANWHLTPSCGWP